MSNIVFLFKKFAVIAFFIFRAESEISGSNMASGSSSFTQEAHCPTFKSSHVSYSVLL
jgi:hypothetical protein